MSDNPDIPNTRQEYDALKRLSAMCANVLSTDGIHRNWVNRQSFENMKKAIDEFLLMYEPPKS